MNSVNPQLAARVWQRVRGEDRLSDRELLAMIAREQSCAETYLQLSRKLQGKAAAALRRLQEREQAHCACLRGIYTLITSIQPSAKGTPLTGLTTESVLRRCYGRQMQALADYEARISDPEYGPVFARLADQERDHCRMLLELIGSLPKV